jgi:hypothetical protein
MNLKKTISSIIKKYDVYIYVYFSFLSKIFYGCTNIHIDTRIDEEKKKKKKSLRGREKNLSSSSNHTTTSVAATVVSSIIIILLHRRLRLSCTNEWMCLEWLSPILFVSLVSSPFFLDFFYYIIVFDEKRRPCFLSLIHSFTHLTLAETTYREQAEKNNIPILDWNMVINNQ